MNTLIEQSSTCWQDKSQSWNKATLVANFVEYDALEVQMEEGGETRRLHTQTHAFTHIRTHTHVSYVGHDVLEICMEGERHTHTQTNTHTHTHTYATNARTHTYTHAR